jgi:type VI protein secretion system component VasF
MCGLFGFSASSPKAATSALRLKVAFRLFGWGFLFGSSAVVAVGYFGFSAVVKPASQPSRLRREASQPRLA